MITSIIVPTDGSEHAAKAVDMAAEIGSKCGAKVTLIHILLHGTATAALKDLVTGLKGPGDVIQKLNDVENQMLDTASVPYGPVNFPVPDDVLQEIGKVVIDDARTRLADAGIGDPTVRILDGSPADVIIEAIEQEDADMIIMGNRGLGKFASLIMGSVSQKVAHLAPCTCVSVK